MIIQTADDEVMPNLEAITGNATLTTVTSSTVMTSTIKIDVTAIYLRIEKVILEFPIIYYQGFLLINTNDKTTCS